MENDLVIMNLDIADKLCQSLCPSLQQASTVTVVYV